MRSIRAVLFMEWSTICSWLPRAGVRMIIRVIGLTREIEIARATIIILISG